MMNKKATKASSSFGKMGEEAFVAFFMEEKQ